MTSNLVPLELATQNCVFELRLSTSNSAFICSTLYSPIQPCSHRFDFVCTRAFEYSFYIIDIVFYCVLRTIPIHLPYILCPQSHFWQLHSFHFISFDFDHTWITQLGRFIIQNRLSHPTPHHQYWIIFD